MRIAMFDKYVLYAYICIIKGEQMADNIEYLPYKSEPVNLHEVEVSIYKNNVNKDKGSYAKVEREICRIDNVIATIKEKDNVPLDVATLRFAAALYKEAFLKLLRQGYSVDFFELGLMYLTASGSITSSDPRKSDIPQLGIGFTASPEAKAALKKVRVRIKKNKDSPYITDFFDYKKNEYTTELTAGGIVNIEGMFLKVAGVGSGVWLAPAGENKGEYDATKMVSVAAIIHTKPSLLTVQLPDGLESGVKYRFIVRTAIAKNRSRPTKTLRHGVSEDTVTVG